MQHASGSFKGVNQADIFYQTWLPDDDSRAGLVIVHGLNEHSGRYGNLVDHFVPQGYALYALDHVGHGRSSGTRAYVDRFEIYVETLHQFVLMVQARLPNRPLFLVGHSMGGLIATAYLIQHPHHLAGAVLSAPAVSVSPDLSPLLLAIGNLLAKVTPKLGVLQLDASAISRDPAVVQAYMDDPLVYAGKVTARLGAELTRTMQRVQVEAAAITLPLLILQGEADRLVSPEGARQLTQVIGSEDKTLRTYPGLYHEIFNEPERGLVLDDMTTWLARQQDMLGAADACGA